MRDAALVPAFAAALLAAAPLNAASDDPQPRAERSTALAQGLPQDATPLLDEFAPFHGPRPDLRVPATAVDLSVFVPPIEDPVIRTLGTGIASYYGRRFHGRLTANGERFNMNAMTAAHKTLPFGTRVKVTNPRNGRSVTVRINDRGPFTRGREIDLSRAAAKKIGMISRGHARVDLDVVN